MKAAWTSLKCACDVPLAPNTSHKCRGENVHCLLPSGPWDVSVLKLANQLVSWVSSCRAQNRRSGRCCWCEQVRPISEVPSLCYRAGWHLGAFTEILVRTAGEDDNTRSQRCTEHSFLGQVKRRSFPGGSDGSKDSACNSVPGWGRSPGEWNANPLQYSCLENSMDWGDWRATVDGVIESDTTEWLHCYYY